MELENSESSLLRISSINSNDISTVVDTNTSVDCNDDDQSASESNYSYTVSVFTSIACFVL